MYIVNGIAYAGESTELLKVRCVKVVGELCLLITFSTGEKRIFDATVLLQYPIYLPLSNTKLFNEVYVEDGTLVWDDGKIDIAPEMIYDRSFPYTESEAI